MLQRTKFLQLNPLQASYGGKATPTTLHRQSIAQNVQFLAVLPDGPSENQEPRHNTNIKKARTWKQP
jgi:hypothetical protein